MLAGTDINPSGPSSDSNSKGTLLATIIGAVAACIAALLAAIVLLLCFRRSRSKPAQKAAAAKSGQEFKNESFMHGSHASGTPQRLISNVAWAGDVDRGTPTPPQGGKPGSGTTTPRDEGGYGDRAIGSPGPSSNTTENKTMGSLDALSESQSDPSAARSEGKPGVVRHLT